VGSPQRHRDTKKAVNHGSNYAACAVLLSLTVNVFINTASTFFCAGERAEVRGPRRCPERVGRRETEAGSADQIAVRWPARFC
jgi:hypothetical protein